MLAEARRPRAALYARVSTADQEGQGQLARLRAWAAEKSCDPVLEVVETATGRHLRRDGLQRVLAEARAHRLDVVAVCKVDRLSRSIVDFAQTLRELHELRVRFVSTDQGFDLSPDKSDPSAVLVMHLMAAFGEWEREMISTRTRESLAHRRAEGKRLGRPPKREPDIREALRQNRLGVPWSTLAQQLGMRRRSLKEAARRLRRRDDGRPTGGTP